LKSFNINLFYTAGAIGDNSIHCTVVAARLTPVRPWNTTGLPQVSSHHHCDGRTLVSDKQASDWAAGWWIRSPRR
jgi:hypothetical protein